MGDRDINGMKARNWKEPPVSGLDSISVKSKNDNVELFGGIKKLIEQAVYTLYGDAKRSDKYVMIVDLIMTRIRAAIAKKLNSVLVSLSDDQLNSIVSSVEDKIQDAQSSGQITSVQQVAETAQTATEEAVEDETKTEDIGKAETEVDSSAVETIEDIGQQLKQFNVDIVRFGSEISTELEKLYDLVNENIDTYKAADTVVESKDQIEQLQALNDNIAKFDIDVANYVERLELVTGKGNVKEQQNAVELSKQYNKRLDKQIRSVSDIISRNFTVLKKDILLLNDDIYKKLDANTKLLDKIVDNQDFMSKLKKILVIVALIGGVLVAIFWKEIWAGIKKWFKNLPIVKTVMGWVDKLQPVIDTVKSIYDTVCGVIEDIKNMDFDQLIDKYWPKIKDGISKGISATWKAIVKFFTEPGNPLEWIAHSLKETWNNFIQFSKDVWAWITGKSKETKDNQENNEKKAEEASQAYVDSKLAEHEKEISSQLQNSEKAFSSGLAQTQKSADEGIAGIGKTLDSVNKSVDDSSKDISKQADAAMASVQKSSDDMVKNANAGISNIEKNTVSKLDKDMKSGLDNAIAGMNKSTDAAIKNAEDKANADMKDLEDKVEKEGKQVPVTSNALKELDKNAEAQGGTLGSSIDDSPKNPQNITSTTVTAEGKTQKLYTDKKQLEEDQKNVQNANKLAGAVYNAGTTSNTINTTANIKVDDKMPDFKTIMADAYKDVVAGTENVVDALKQQASGIDGLKQGISNYIEKLDQFIEEKSKNNGNSRSSGKDQPAQPSVTIIAPDGRSDSMAGENH